MQKLIISVSLALLAFSLATASSGTATEVSAEPVFARINDLVISESEFEQIFAAAVRHKYYHGKVPTEELEKFKAQVVDDIVTQVLVHDQALRRGLQPDRAKIDRGIDEFNLKNAANPDWEQRRDKIIPRLVERLERQDLIEKMEARIRDIEPPSDAQVRRFYLDQPDKFTEPERLWIAVILLPVAPAASEDVWSETEATAAQLKRRIESGEDFAELARGFSAHASAADGGDLGYLHQGVLETRVQEQVAALEIGQLSEPVRVLEGITLFQLRGVQPARLRQFDEVRQRAADLLYRELQDQAWKNYVQELRAAANIYVNRQ